MGVSFHLKKPLYYRPDEATGDKFRYSLGEDVVKWLEEHDVEYRTYWNDVTHQGQRLLWFYIKIADPNKAMLFKLTWL